MARKVQSLIEFFNLEAPFATEFRRLLHKLTHAKDGPELKSLLITSAMLSEGKSTVTSFLALTAATHKRIKTLLIDTDLRRPSIHRFFQLERERGLSEVLSSDLTANEVIKKTPVSTLDIITAGKTHAAPAEVFDAETIGGVIEEMKFYYDLILVDSAPVLPVSDPMLLASKTDALLMVVKAGFTKQEIVQRAVTILNGTRLLGVVLNNVNRSLPYYYDYGYYGYEYHQRPPSKKGRRKERDDRSKGKKSRTPDKDSAPDGTIKR